MKNIKLYHFTSMYHLPDIMVGGISKGDVATSPTGGFNAPCFTTNTNKSQQGWSSGTPVDKLQVRITVEIDEHDPRLKKWNDVMKEHKASKRWIKATETSGSHNTAAWYVYMGSILPEQFKEVRIDEKRKGIHPVIHDIDGGYCITYQELV